MIDEFYGCNCVCLCVCARVLAVYTEVETRISALRNLLLDKLLEMPSTLHDQKRYIRWVEVVQFFIITQHKHLLICLVYRYLSDLHAPGDPAWQCIVAQHKWILQLMQNCKEDFIKEQRGLETNWVFFSSCRGKSTIFKRIGNYVMSQVYYISKTMCFTPRVRKLP